VTETARRIAARYIGDDEAAADDRALGADVRGDGVRPGDIRVWDFADEYDAG
jgi:hypothetical protein